MLEALIGAEPEADVESDPPCVADSPSNPGVRHLVPQLPSGIEETCGQASVSSQRAQNIEDRVSVTPVGVQDLASFQNRRSAIEHPSPDGRGCREAAGEGYIVNPSLGTSPPLAQSGEHRIGVTPFGVGEPASFRNGALANLENRIDRPSWTGAAASASPTGRSDKYLERVDATSGKYREASKYEADGVGVLDQKQLPVESEPPPRRFAPPLLARRGDPADIANMDQPEKGSILYPSPGPSGHPLPSGEGLLPVSSKSAGTAKNTTNVEDPTILLNVLGHAVAVPVQVEIRPDVQSNLPNLVQPAQPNEPRLPERLNLAEFGVTRFEYKTEFEPHSPPVLQSAQMWQLVRTAVPVRETKPSKPGAAFDSLLQDANSQAAPSSRPVLLTRTEEVQTVRLVFEPPPPPPVVRSVSMDIGDPDSQVRVVIRERNGNLNVQLGSTNERLKEDLQAAGPILMRELQRNNPMSVTLDFSNFGSATDADRQSGQQPKAKKLLKSDAEFADVVETTYLSAPSSELNSL